MDNNIRRLRQEIGLTQEELARKVNATRQTINAIENNKYSPTLELAFKLAKVFGKTVDEVFIFGEE